MDIVYTKKNMILNQSQVKDTYYRDPLCTKHLVDLNKLNDQQKKHLLEKSLFGVDGRNGFFNELLTCKRQRRV